MSHWQENLPQTIERERWTPQAISRAADRAAKEIDEAGRALPVLVASYRDTVRKTLHFVVANNHHIYDTSRWRWVGTYEPGTSPLEIERDAIEWFKEHDQWHRKGYWPSVAMDPVEATA